MKKRHIRFLLYFVFIFSINLMTNFVFKDAINVLTAFSIALGVSAGIVYLSPYLIKR
ncbi:hypothetical protein [Sporosarcina sp.]|uniref:hypothetical protein n=1 Tax=Sporosarcina sp. TaxID=49982 RepID=UPI00260DDEE6|nr:hypothetical protein [Sporosarcina sp.]